MAAAVFVLAAPVWAEPPSDPLNWLGGPIAPHLFALDLDDRGLPSYPFDPLNDAKSGVAANMSSRVSRQFTEGSRQALHVNGALRLESRLGVDFAWSRFDSGAFNLERRTDRLAMHATADLSERDGRFLEYGLGFTTLQSDQSLWGPSFELLGERRLAPPWTLYARYSLAFMNLGASHHELSAGVGPSWKRLGVEAGYRAFLNPLRNVYGPEIALKIWL